MARIVHERPICALPTCGKAIDYDPVYAPFCQCVAQHSLPHASMVWHPLCLMQWRDETDRMQADLREALLDAPEPPPVVLEVLKRLGLI